MRPKLMDPETRNVFEQATGVRHVMRPRGREAARATRQRLAADTMLLLHYNGWPNRDSRLILYDKSHFCKNKLKMLNASIKMCV